MFMKTLIAAAATFCLLASGASAATVFAPISGTSTSPIQAASSGFGGVDAFFDGGSLGYTSGVSDYATVAAKLESYGPLSDLGSLATPFPVTIDFTFGDLLSVTDVAIWNQSGSASLREFELYASASGLFDDLVGLGSFSANQGSTANLYSFAATNLTGLRMVVTSNYGYGSGVRFNEIIVGGSIAAVPVPASGILLLGALGLMGVGRRRRKAT